ncbi:MAG: hypothetical protein ACE5KP_07410 [Dehalococcoidales bacterium]
MDKQTLINQAVDRYHRLDRMLSNEILSDENKAFLQGRMLELMLFIYTLDEQAILRLTECPEATKPENVSVAIRLLRVNLN